MKQLLFPEEYSGNSLKNDLFGMDNISTPVTNSLGGNLHQLNDNQINKLINLKFSNQPISLIKQLSYDLALKELELILLRKEKFLRERELLKMCNEYGNLSSMEIDQKLNSLKVEENVDNVLLGLIEHAINEDLKQGTPDNDTVGEKNELKDNDTSETALARLTSSAGWISDCFIEPSKLYRSTSSLLLNKESSKSKNVKIGHSHFQLSLSSLPVAESSSETRMPVELDTINTRSLVDTPDISTTASIDKYGFFSDMTEFSEKDSTGTSVGSKQKIMPNEIMFNTKPELYVNETNSLEVTGTTNIGMVTPSIDKLKEIGQIHDAKNMQLEVKWDHFFKHLLQNYYRHMGHNPRPQDVNYNSAISSHEIFGRQGFNLIKFEKSQTKFGSSSVSSPDMINLKKLRKLINENGIPLKYRYNLWLELSGAKNLRVPGEFHNLANEARNTDNATTKSNIRQIDLDLHRTLPSNIYFNDLVHSQPGPNFYKLQNILYAFVAYNPEIGYCQGMNKIVGNLLLGDNRFAEEDIFWIFTSFVDDVLPKYNCRNFFNIHSLTVIRIDQRIMGRHYFPRLLPKLNAHFSKLNLQIEYITLNWWILLFTDGLPLDIWFKFFDNFLVSQMDVTLITLTLSLFKIFEKCLLELHTCNDIYVLMKDLNNTMDSSKLNIKYHELMSMNTMFEKKIAREDLPTLRNLYND